MPQSRMLLFGIGVAALSLSPSFSQTPTRAVGEVTNWPTPLYWQPVQSQAHGNRRVAKAEILGPEALAVTAATPAIFVAVTPCRLLDTRPGEGFSGAFGPPVLAANTARKIPVPTSSCGVQAGAAYSLNITAVPSAGAFVGYIKAWPNDQPEPNTAVLVDTIAGAVISNSAIVPAGADGGIQILAQTSTDLVVDINGYFALPGTVSFGGTSNAPALTFGDQTTGLFSTAAGTLGIATGGVAAVSINAVGNLDLRGSITKGGKLFLHNLGDSNTAAGLNALAVNTASGNTAMGISALKANTTGSTNTALGDASMQSNIDGNDNTAVGAITLFQNTTGFQNTAAGRAALGANTTGNDNTGIGYGALASLAVGNNNAALGATTLENMITGRDNTALGASAGASLIGGSYNIYIYNPGTASDNGVIRIGTTNQTSAFIAGIRGVTTGQATGIPIVIDANGQLGTVSSSRRVKRDIADAADTTETLMGLRPVQFRYTAHGPDSPLQYGLIAEEVAEVAPELVARKADGEVETVYYDKVNAMLLSLVQKQQRTIEEMKTQNESLLTRTAAHDAELQSLRDQFAEALQTIESRRASPQSLGAK